MRTIQEIQADIKVIHDKAVEENVPLHFQNLAVLQNELNEALLPVLASPVAGISDEQKAFNDKVSAALFNDPVPAAAAAAAQPAVQ